MQVGVTAPIGIAFGPERGEQVIESRNALGDKINDVVV